MKLLLLWDACTDMRNRFVYIHLVNISLKFYMLCELQSEQTFIG